MPRAGSLRERVTIEQEVPVDDGMGGQGKPEWSEIAHVPTVWARVMPIRGSERVQAMQLEAAVSHEVTIRYRTDLTAKHRLLWGSSALNIRAVYHDEKRRHTTLLCDQGVAT
ncbi:MAG: phage head closure protein [Hyphomicrobiaceae bacterium]